MLSTNYYCVIFLSSLLLLCRYANIHKYVTLKNNFFSVFFNDEQKLQNCSAFDASNNCLSVANILSISIFRRNFAVSEDDNDDSIHKISGITLRIQHNLHHLNMMKGFVFKYSYFIIIIRL